MKNFSMYRVLGSCIAIFAAMGVLGLYVRYSLGENKEADLIGLCLEVMAVMGIGLMIFLGLVSKKPPSSAANKET